MSKVSFLAKPLTFGPGQVQTLATGSSRSVSWTAPIARWRCAVGVVPAALVTDAAASKGIRVRSSAAE